jgi:hypothetical protein
MNGQAPNPDPHENAASQPAPSPTNPIYIYYPAVVLKWPQMEWKDMEGKPRTVPLNEFFREDKSIGFLPVYLTMEALRQVHPDCGIWRMEMSAPIEPGKRFFIG